jgi:hypothetical protein
MLSLLTISEATISKAAGQSDGTLHGQVGAIVFTSAAFSVWWMSLCMSQNITGVYYQYLAICFVSSLRLLLCYRWCLCICVCFYKRLENVARKEVEKELEKELER